MLNDWVLLRSQLCVKLCGFVLKQRRRIELLTETSIIGRLGKE